MVESKEKNPKTCCECIFYSDGEWAGAWDFPVHCLYLNALTDSNAADGCKWFFERNKAFDIIVKHMG